MQVKNREKKKKERDLSLHEEWKKYIDDERIILEIFFYKFYPTIGKFCNVANRLESW